MTAMDTIDQPLDVLIVGAGISGIGMAAHLKAECPQRSFAILDRRARPGGTWDLFRYPGIRSDSDMYTLGFAFEPWGDETAIAAGDRILDYLDRVIDTRGLRDHMRFGQTVLSADWDSTSGLWTVESETADGKRVSTSAHFLFLGSGYYDYDNPHDAGIPGLKSFGGEVIHPQFWPENHDHSGKRVVVIGSGATAVTLVPSLAGQASHVTMLQRTPSYYLERPAKDGLANVLRRVLPSKWAYALIRARNIVMQDFLFKRARQKPQEMGEYLKDQVRTSLGEAWDEAAFSPPYNPWEQRLCLVPDGDMFNAIKAGKADIVTGQIKAVDKTGIVLEDGRRLDADVIVTATGLKLAVCGKIALRMDGEAVNFADHWYYRNCMFSNVPNFAALFGYLNAGWTLRVDIVAEWLCRLFNQMDAWGVDVVVPELKDDSALVEHSAFDDFSSGYIARGRHLIPRSAAESPWQISMDYRADRQELRHAPIDDGLLKFSRLPVAAAAE